MALSSLALVLLALLVAGGNAAVCYKSRTSTGYSAASSNANFRNPVTGCPAGQTLGSTTDPLSTCAGTATSTTLRTGTGCLLGLTGSTTDPANTCQGTIASKTTASENAVVGNSITQKQMMLWGCTLEGNPWLTYKLTPKKDPVYNMGSTTWTTIGYNFACMNNAVPSIMPDQNLVSSTFNPGNAAFPPVWTLASVEFPPASWSTATGKGDGTGPSSRATSAWCGAAYGCSGTSGPGKFLFTGNSTASTSGTTTTYTYDGSNCQQTTTGSGIAGTYYIGAECAIPMPVQIPAAGTPVCLMIVCGSSNASIGCAFEVSLQVGTSYDDALIASSAAAMHAGLTALFVFVSVALLL